MPQNKWFSTTGTLVLVILFLVYKPWFSGGSITGGDWPYYFSEYLDTFSLPFLWNNQWPFGLGGNQTIILPLKMYLHIPIYLLVARLGMSWEIVQKLFWFWGFLALSAYSSWRFTRSMIGVLIYLTNTWVLMIVGGGQMGIAMAYALLPLVIEHFQSVISRNYSYVSILRFGLSLSLLILFDYRIAYICLIVISTVYAFTVFLEKGYRRRSYIKLLFRFGIGMIFVLLLNAFWILPLGFIRISWLTVPAETYTDSSVLSFFSVARFPQAFSLLHPNWPENIFGKVYLMYAQFLLVPLLSFVSLFFISKRNTQNSNFIVFALIGLLGAFLAKGVNEPFGVVYRYLFEYMPGFVMFRDPTKFYVLVALSYSILMPYSLSSIGLLLYSKFKIKNSRPRAMLKTQNSKQYRTIQIIVNVVFITIWLLSIHEAWLGHLGGTFIHRRVPDEYNKLKDFINSRPEYTRTLWLPRRARFGFYSDTHTALDSLDILPVKSASEAAAWLHDTPSQEQLTRWGVGTIIVPHDPEGEFFTTNYRYCSKCREEIIHSLDEVRWLRKEDGFTDNAVYSVDNPHSLLFSPDGTVTWHSRSIVNYELETYPYQGSIIFSQSYDPGWQLCTKVQCIGSKKTYDGLMEFTIPSMTDTMPLTLTYQPQKYLYIGELISVAALCAYITFLFKHYFHTRNR